MKNLTIKNKLLIIVISTIITVSIILAIEAIYTINQISKQNIEKYTIDAYKNKELNLKNYVSLAMNTLKDEYDKMSQEGLSEEEAKQNALKAIEKIRYGEEGYFWINDISLNMLMHPVSKSLVGRNVSEVKDPEGKYFFKEIEKIAKDKASGLVTYVWNKPGFDKPQPKYTYIEVFKPWGWVIATGSYLDDVENSVAQMQALSDEDTADAIMVIFIGVILLTVIISTIVVFIANRMIVKPLSKLTGTVKALTKFSSADQKININSKDEIGDLARYFNEYLESIRKVTAQDQKIVEESEKAIEMVRAGFFAYKVESSTENRSTNDLKNAINVLIDEFKEHLGEVNSALNEYSKGNFEYDFDVKNVSGNLGSVVRGTKSIGDNVSEILATIMTSGEKLANNIEILTSSATSLSDSANAQAASLEETAAAVEEINSNIQNSTQNMEKMKELDDVVMNSAQKGQELAHQTATSMDEINTEVESIADAITVIDQIAFQTNILSLNAAVEAATAGEAGKGFAVVAAEVRNLANRSAEAAKEIKDLVEKATSKANNGKTIADTMIKGYDELQNAIVQTKQIIDNVANASKEQGLGIAQINDAITILDKNTQENASDATSIANLANEVKELSTNLISVAQNAKFKESARAQIADTNLVYELNNLKLQHILFKENNFARIAENSKITVVNETQCNLGKWILQVEKEGKPFTKTANWQALKDAHKRVHGGVQCFLDKNLEHAPNEKLIEIGNGVEIATAEVFKALDTVKVENANL
ncbi:cache domain-containing protein [Halarcobacter bivalviorum]|uniref:Cache sensor-containing MCP-domain signal transduction protein n=1 Tax=Halarcobacter bivalviorum TaxID=663364 RepID=A0AAX2A6Q7_9BACT|nr:cache domain-containing protein [Halarcobacter bivalviorum]AXH13597.1 Cache sensor-containing MCP-domain signal transduction protein [Halarcobacter bivalviorum]RXK09798.1 chemotaxis protein [Halarcobacter bivalviorum]